MTAVAAIARAAFLRGARDRRLVFTAVLLPVFIMLVVGLIFGTGGRRLPVGVISSGSGRLGSRFVHELRSNDQVKVRTYHRQDRLRADLRRGRIVAGVVLPRGDDRVVTGGGVGRPLVITQPGRTDGIAARAAVAFTAAVQSDELAGARFAHEQTGVPEAAALARAERFTDQLFGRRPRTRRPQSPFAYTAPSNLVLFTFITALAGGVAHVRSRQLGITRRMLATPTRPIALLAGLAVGALLLTLGQAVMLLAVGWVLFGVRWGDPAGVAVLVACVVVTATSAGLVVGTIARTPEQALSVGVPAGIALGMLGGCMWSLDIVGPAMRALGHLFPHAWAMDAFVRLIFDRGGLRSIAGPVAVLVAYAAVLCTVAAWRLRRSVVAA